MYCVYNKQLLIVTLFVSSTALVRQSDLRTYIKTGKHGLPIGCHDNIDVKLGPEVNAT